MCLFDGKKIVGVKLETPVEEVIIEGKTVKGVRTSDVDFMADKVIMNADFHMQ